MPWRGILECLEHKIKGDNKICKRCNLKHMCGTWAENEKKRRKREKVKFT
jgi:hypothetical protein